MMHTEILLMCHYAGIFFNLIYSAVLGKVTPLTSMGLKLYNSKTSLLENNELIVKSK